MDRLEAAAQERGAFQSEVFRRAVRFYISENPDDIRAFTGSTIRSPPDSGGPTRDADEADARSGVYDPMGDR